LDTERRQLRAVLGGMVEGVVALDARQIVLFANDRAGELLEFDPVQSVGRRFWEVVRHRRLHELVGAALAGPDPVRGELDWTGANVRQLTVYIARLVSQSGSSSGAPAVLVVHDMTELRRLERVRQDFV